MALWTIGRAVPPAEWCSESSKFRKLSQDLESAAHAKVAAELHSHKASYIRTACLSHQEEEEEADVAVASATEEVEVVQEVAEAAETVVGEVVGEVRTRASGLLQAVIDTNTIQAASATEAEAHHAVEGAPHVAEAETAVDEAVAAAGQAQRAARESSSYAPLYTHTLPRTHDPNMVLHRNPTATPVSSSLAAKKTSSSQKT